MKFQTKKTRKLLADDGGKEGARLTRIKVRISGSRADHSMVMRSRPGSFEWRYGRNKQGALFHAGSHFAQLWERAGATVASSADFLRGTSSGFRCGIAEGRVSAIDALAGAVREMGRFSSDRLIDYCVTGMTTGQIAAKNGMTEREASAALHQDLRQCAIHFRFLSTA